jgi:hypothetical protein
MKNLFISNYSFKKGDFRLQLSEVSRPTFEFPVSSAGTSAGRRRRRRSSSIAPLPPAAEGEERLRELRRTISARPPTSNLYPAVLDSSDDEEGDKIGDMLEDVSEDDDLNFLSDSEPGS